jgi:L-threonylcarbamoyladenylate synthase
VYQLFTLPIDHHTINEHDPQIEIAAKHILSDEIVLYPTDTTYALGVNALSEIAIERVYSLKQRAPRKPIHVVVADLPAAEQYVILNARARILAQTFLPGPLTLVLPHRKNIPENLVSGLATLGFRIPDNAISIALARAAGVPITTTSANLSGQGDTYTVRDCLTQLGSPAGEEIAVILDQGELPHVRPSTVVDLSKSDLIIIREGPIPEFELRRAIALQGG